VRASDQGRRRTADRVLALVASDLPHQAPALAGGQQVRARRADRQPRLHRTLDLGPQATQAWQGGHGDQAQREERDDDEQHRAACHGEDLQSAAAAARGIDEDRLGIRAPPAHRRVRDGH